MPSFQTCFRQREGELWVCEYPEVKLDFKMMENCNVREEIDKFLSRPFVDASEGPLWCLRVIPAHPDTPCPLPEIKGEFPYQNDVLFFVHHGTADGVSMMVNLMNFLKLLDDVVSGTPVDPEPYGKVVGEQQTIALEKEMLERLESKPQEFQSMIDEAAKVKFTPLFQQAFGIPPKPHFPMDSVWTKLDGQVLQDFHGRCRTLGITLNSGLASAVDTALVELVAEGGLERELYSVTGRHCVSQRRYWKGGVTDLGSHLGVMSKGTNTPRHNRTGFWNYAKQFDLEFRRKLNEGDIFQERIIGAKIRPKDYSHESFYSSPPPIACDYMISNLFMPHFSNFGIGNKIQLSHFNLNCNISHCNYPTLHMLLPFRDTLTYQILFASGRLSRDTAQTFLDKIIDVISTVTK